MIKATPISGLGKAAHYMKLYTKYFQSTLNFTPFPGTINLPISPELPQEKKITITPTESNIHAIDCYKILINNKYKGAIVVPHKTIHNNITEIIVETKIPLGDEIICELV